MGRAGRTLGFALFPLGGTRGRLGRLGGVQFLLSLGKTYRFFRGSVGTVEAQFLCDGFGCTSMSDLSLILVVYGLSM